MPAGPAHLEIHHDGQAPRQLVLGDATIRIGRARENDVVAPEGHVSKQHAEIRREGDGYVIADTGSRAGVMVNGIKIDRRELADGDVVELGPQSPVRITFHRERARRMETSFTSVVSSAEQGSMARLARFFEFSHKLGGGFALEEVLQDVVDLALEVTKAERGLLILRRDDDSLETKVARARGGRSLPPDGLRVSETLVRKALADGKPGIVTDLNQDADLALAASIVSLELRSAVTLPLLRLGGNGDDSARETATMQAFGLVYLDSRRQRAGFDGFDLGILTRLANDASAVIENARLLREEAETRRMAREVAMAREVQAALMPEQWRSTTTFEVAGLCVPCHELGGDYVDQFDLGGGRVALVVADVAGKGIAASLLAATLQGALAAEMANGRPLGEVVARVNRVHCRLAPVGKFVTLAVVLLEPDGTLTLVNAGHCPVLHVSRSGTQALTTGGMALGLDADHQYDAVTLRMAAGDALVLYTDGVIECENAAHDLFGDERLERAVAGHPAPEAAALLGGIVRAVEQFRGAANTSDDLSVLVVRRR